MFRNYFYTAVRNMLRSNRFSFIHMAGLTLGLSATMLIALFVWDEYQYDKFIPGGQEVYRIYNQVSNNQGTEEVSVTPPVYATTLQREFPSVEHTARVMMLGEHKQLFEAGGKQLYEDGSTYADSTFFAVFPFKFVYGAASGALNDLASLVLSRQMADLFFANENPVGKTLLIDKQPFRVTGVFEKNPKFHLEFDFLQPLSSMSIPADRMQSWQWQQFSTYARVYKGADIRSLQENFQHLVKERADPKTKSQGFRYLPFFQPLREIYLHSASFKFEQGQRGNFVYVNALIIIAVFILIIACFNFINLSTAVSIRRAREVGVRKTIGASKRQLILQFTGETILLALLATLLAVLLTRLLLPSLNHFTGKEISSWMLLNPLAIGFFLVLTAGVGVLAGFYPALVLSGFEPVKVLKAGSFSGRASGRMPWLRQGLVIIQFTLSILLILSAVIVFRQVDYLHNKDLGFSREQIMFFQLRGDNLSKNLDAFKSELNRVPGISSVSIGYGFPGDAVAGDEIIVDKGGQKVTQGVTQLAVDYDYIKTLRLSMVAGRDFSKNMGTDRDHAWIINETAVKTLGFGTPQKALGRTLYWHPWDGNNPDSLKVGQVIGVVKDFNYKSLYDKIEPAVLQIYPLAAFKVAVKMKTADLNGTIAQVRTVWNQFEPQFPLEYKFLDENFQQMYSSEDKLESLLWVFTGVAIFIACLGLFGLAAYTAEARRKEMGIRKVLGANSGGVMMLLSKDFIRPVLISLFIASPITWYLMHLWLQEFPYRIAISWWIFLLAGLTATLIAMLTVSYQAIRAARANPVKSLRSE